MKKHYVKPVMIGEKFIANEYVSACWGVACDTTAANQIENKLPAPNPWGGHRPGECGQFTHQYIITDANNVPIHMQEIYNSYFKENLDCTIFTDDSYTTQKDISTVKIGDTIHWITDTSAGVYHHVGTVQAAYIDHPNRS